MWISNRGAIYGRFGSLAVGLVFVSVFFVVLWHLVNRALPISDSANYAHTSLQIAQTFRLEGLWKGLQAVVNLRGQRPNVLPPVAVPFLLFLRNDIVAACAAVLALLYAALAFYVYRFSQLFSSDRVVCGTVCTLVISSPLITSHYLSLYSEALWLPVSIACIYHLLKSGPLLQSAHAAVAGFWGGLMCCTRPVESTIVLVVWLAVVVIPKLQDDTVVLHRALTISGLLGVPVVLLLASAWIPQIGRIYITMACLLAVIVCVAAVGPRCPALVAFSTLLVTLPCLWWAGFMPALRRWAEAASDFVSAAGMRSAGYFWYALRMQASDYGEVQLCVLAILAIFPIALTRHVPKNRLASSVIGQEIEKPLFYAASLLFVIFIGLYATAGSDPRRSLLALVLFIAAAALFTTTRSRAAQMAVGIMAITQLTFMGCTIAGSPMVRSFGALGYIPAPKPEVDGNVEAARQLARYVPAGRRVGIYTLSHFQGRGKIYDPAALAVACLEQGYDFTVGYVFEPDSYGEGIEQLRKSGFTYLLLDSYPELAPGSKMPYDHFIYDLLKRTNSGAEETPDLRLIAKLPIGGRNHFLFRILSWPLPPGDVNLAADYAGSIAYATENEEGFPVANLNDGTDAAWGSGGSLSDVYAAIRLPSRNAVSEIRLRLFTPSGRPHLRDIRIVAADPVNRDAPAWEFVRARLRESKEFANVITVPPLPDDSEVTIELDRTDPHWGPHLMWGFACLRSRSDRPNYLPAGNGVYVRELEVK